MSENPVENHEEKNMNKIAIVGVKGSGKTVLMSTLGEKYWIADSFGLLLSPENQDAFDFVKVNMAKMRGGGWPMETPHDSVRAMCWSLQRERAGGPNKVFCDLEFLDFGGEIYTAAFGNVAADKADAWADECAILKEHIKSSQMLVVLVNLRDIVSGATDPDTLAALWVTKGILDYVSRDLKLVNRAIAFTQVDAYRDVIKACGGLPGVLKTYMPHVYNIYRDLPLFALSAVDKTVPGADGLPCPAPGFASQGLDDLVHWILGCTEAGREDADGIEKIKRRPHDLWYGIVAGMDALRADAARPTGLSAAERFENVTALQTAAAELAVNPLRNTVPGFSDEALAERRQELDGWAKFAGQAAEFVKAVSAKRADLAAQLEAGLAAEAAPSPHLLPRVREEARQIRASQKRRNAVRGLIAAGFAGMLAFGGFAVCSHNASVDRLVSEKGYTCETSYGIKHAVWRPGKKHPTSPYLRTSETVEEWKSTRLGYAWVKGTATVRWQPGLQHPDNKMLVSADSVDDWNCICPGWKWVEGTSRTEWQVGEVHPTCPDLKASTEPGKWVSTKKGYEWDGKNGVVVRIPSVGDMREIELPCGVKMKMVWCPPCPQGFWMGSPILEKGHNENEHLHFVKLTKGFWIGQFEVTQWQWERVMGSNPSHFKGADLPVEGVSWNDCQRFIAKINADGRYKVSLPTEAQWEYACRAGTETPFCFGSVLNGDKANANGYYPYGTTVKGRYIGHTVRVGSYEPNDWNIYDMHGNVSEWCEDHYDSDFYKYEAERVDPCCTSGESRVLRGGGWYGSASYCRSASRDWCRPGLGSGWYGFRLLCSAGPHE